MGGFRYDDPNFLIMRHEHLATLTSSSAAAQTVFTSSTMKVWTKAIVLGCQFMIHSGPSAASTTTISIRRGTSIAQNFVSAVSATASANGDVWDLSLTTGLTLLSAGEICTLASNLTSNSVADKLFTISDIIWRYRLLPQELPETMNG